MIFNILKQVHAPVFFVIKEFYFKEFYFKEFYFKEFSFVIFDESTFMTSFKLDKNKKDNKGTFFIEQKKVFITFIL